QVWVAQGIYKPTSGTNRDISFVVGGGVELYGGFSGVETLLSQRNWRTYTTILSGDIGSPGNAGDNTLLIVTNGAPSTPMVIDGFTIEGGYHDGTAGDFYGGGIRCSGTTTLRNLVIRDNYSISEGGGVAIYDGFASGTVRIESCVFSNNRALVRGGGLWNLHSAFVYITNSLFVGN